MTRNSSPSFDGLLRELLRLGYTRAEAEVEVLEAKELYAQAAQRGQSWRLEMLRQGRFCYGELAGMPYSAAAEKGPRTIH